MGTSASKENGENGDGLSPEHVENYLKSIQSADQNLVVLDLSNCGIDTTVALMIAQALPQHDTLQVLVLKDNPAIGDLGALSIADGLRHHTSIERVDLSGTGIGSVGAAAIGDALKTNACIKELRLSNNHISKDGVDVLASGLTTTSSASSSRTIVNGSHNNNTGDGSAVQVLDLSANGLGADAAVSLAAPLASNTSLLELNLQDNELGMEGAMAIAEALSFNTCLQKINLRNNDIQDIGAMAIAATLETNNSLKVVQLGNNGIGQEGAIAVVTATARKGSSVEELDLEHENGTDIVGKAAAASPERNGSGNNGSRTSWISSRDAISPPR